MVGYSSGKRKADEAVPDPSKGPIKTVLPAGVKLATKSRGRSRSRSRSISRSRSRSRSRTDIAAHDKDKKAKSGKKGKHLSRSRSRGRHRSRSKSPLDRHRSRSASREKAKVKIELSGTFDEDLPGTESVPTGSRFAKFFQTQQPSDKQYTSPALEFFDVHMIDISDVTTESPLSHIEQVLEELGSEITRLHSQVSPLLAGADFLHVKLVEKMLIGHFIKVLLIMKQQKEKQ